MAIESIPHFSARAAKLWDLIPDHARQELLSNAWCGKCRHAVSLVSFSGKIRAGDLLLVGKCSECHGVSTRVVEFQCGNEGDQTGERRTHIVLGPPRLTEAESLVELEHVREELVALTKRIGALTRKSNNGTATRKEEAELNRLFKKEFPAITDKWIRVHYSGRTKEQAG
jgi:hypothetical protein